MQSARAVRIANCPVDASAAVQAGRFLASGGSSTLMHWAAMGLLVQGGLSPLLSTAIGAFTGAVSNYFLQFYWAFNGKGVHGSSMPVYAFTVILGGLLNAGLFHLLTALIHVGIVPAQIFSTAAVAVMNFVIYKRIVFHERII